MSEIRRIVKTAPGAVFHEALGLCAVCLLVLGTLALPSVL